MQSHWGIAQFLFFSLFVSSCKPVPPPAIQSQSAKEYMNQFCVVEMVVRASKHESDRPICYLDSEIDYKDPSCVAVVISDESLPLFRKIGINEPHNYYKNRRLQVTGQIVHREDQIQIHVTSPEQIRIVDAVK